MLILSSTPLYRFLILLTPCAMLAACYQLLGLIANALGPETVARDCLPIRTTKIAKIFVTIDIVTFVLQLSGSGMSIQDGNMGKLGKWIALVGSTSSSSRTKLAATLTGLPSITFASQLLFSLVRPTGFASPSVNH